MDSLKRYQKTVKILISKINNKFSSVTFLTVDEIIKDEIDFSSTWWELNKIQDYSYSESKKIKKELEKLSEEEYDKWGYEIEDEVDDLHNLIDWKVMSLQSLIDTIQKINNVEEEEEILKYFKDIKPIDI